jgi:hypothetical protein
MIVRLGDDTLNEILNPDVRSNFIAMWKRWLGIG